MRRGEGEENGEGMGIAEREAVAERILGPCWEGHTWSIGDMGTRSKKRTDLCEKCTAWRTVTEMGVVAVFDKDIKAFPSR